MPKRKAIIHIGTAKTGSTTIQRMLAGNREALNADGFAYPRAPGRNNHMKLAACGAEPRTALRMMRVLGEKDELGAVLERLRRDLDAEFSALPDGVHTVIFSNEHCYSKINSPEAAERLRDFLSPWFDAFRIVVYLRRQDEFAVSRYTTRLRAGGHEVSVLPSANAIFEAADDDEDSAEEGDATTNVLTGSTTQPISRMLDWSIMLDNWAAAFGKPALQPRIFDRSAFEGGDLVLDFVRCCGLPETYAQESRSLNASLRPEAQEFLRRYNEARAKAFGEGVKPPKVDAALKNALTKHYTGSGRLPLREDAEAFVARFADANRRLRDLYFPDREQVFSTDFSKYPVLAEPLPPDAAVLEVALRVLIGDAESASAEAADAAVQRGEQFLAQGRPDKAAEAIREALRISPNFGRAKRAMRTLERSGRARLHDAAAGVGDAANPEPEEHRPVAVALEGVASVIEKPKLSPEERAARRERRGDPAAEAKAADAGAAEKPKLSLEERAARRERRAERQRQRGAQPGAD